MKNNYEIRGDVTAIYLKSAKHGDLETLISTDKLDRVKELPNTWCPSYKKSMNSFYVVGTLDTKKKQVVSIHRWILESPDDLVVDHINHDTLNNTNSNIRNVTKSENQQNRLGGTKRNTSGYRGVSWSKESQKWTTKIKVNGKAKYLGMYEDIKEANNVVKRYRMLHMPFSQEI